MLEEENWLTEEAMERMMKEVEGLMGGKFRQIAQVFCGLLLALSLSLATVVPAMAAEFPSISPTTADYDLDDPAEVVATVSWGDASNIVGISDDDGNLTSGLTRDYIVLVKHLIILNSYLEDKLLDIGDSVELVIRFDLGAATLTITATGTQPSITPTTAQYDLDDPADVETTVTWGIARDVESITENGNDVRRVYDYTEGDTVGGEATLTIRDGYLEDELTDIGDEIVLTIEFDHGEDAVFTITAKGTPPSISPTTAQYNIDSPADVKTTITWGIAASLAPPVDDDGYTLTSSQYARTGTDLTIRDRYLEDKLKDIGDAVVLTINFNVGGNATFTITATGINAVVSPQAKNYDLDNPADVSTTITWNTAGALDSTDPIVDDDSYALKEDEDYGFDEDTDTLVIFDEDYLQGKLTDIGDDVVLTIKFDLGADATFTITAVGIQPRISPQTEEYDLENRTNAVTTITWGTAENVTSIVDGDGYMLVRNTDYTVTSNGDTATLTIREHYLGEKHMDIGDSLELKIDFDVGADATFTIASMGIQPSIYPVTADHDVIDRNDVSTIITWGSAESVVSIVDDDGYLLEEGVHYIVIDYMSDMSANLTIFSSTYLAGKLGSFGEKLVLTIGFDVGGDATFTITVPEVCFIATAAYGTPLAEEIEILRKFRDEYLMTNPAGQAVVHFYYRVSPPMAEFITEHPSLKPIVRAGLFPAVVLSSVAVSATPIEKMGMLGLLVLILVAAAVWTRRRRGTGPQHS
jgi:hypothetical protein